MKYIKRILPNLTISLMMVLLALIIFNQYNPFMGFLNGTASNVVIICAAVSGILTSILLIADNFKN